MRSMSIRILHGEAESSGSVGGGDCSNSWNTQTTLAQLTRCSCNNIKPVAMAWKDLWSARAVAVM